MSAKQGRTSAVNLDRFQYKELVVLLRIQKCPTKIVETKLSLSFVTDSLNDTELMFMHV